MIKFGQGYSQDEASFEDAEVGDAFTMIEYDSYGAGIMSAIDYTITKTGKRDITCASKSGRIFTVKRNKTESSCYPVGHVEVIAARKEIALSNRKMKCAKILESSPVIHKHFDEQFMTAIEEFGARLDKAKDAREEAQ